MTKREFDELIRWIMLDADRVEYGGVPEEEPGHVFPPAFERQMRRPPGRGRHPLYRTLRAAACFLLALLLSGCTMLAVSPAVWEAFSPWGAAPVPGNGAVKMVGSTQAAPCAYRLGWVPEGYELFVSGAELPARIVYLSRDGKWLALSIVDSAEAMKVEAAREKKAAYRQVLVSGRPASLYSGGKGTRSALVWTDEGKGLRFHLNGELTEEELVKIAEHVGKEPVRPAPYRLMWVCHGGSPDAGPWITDSVSAGELLQMNESAGRLQ